MASLVVSLVRMHKEVDNQLCNQLKMQQSHQKRRIRHCLHQIQQNYRNLVKLQDLSKVCRHKYDSYLWVINNESFDFLIR